MLHQGVNDILHYLLEDREGKGLCAGWIVTTHPVEGLLLYHRTVTIPVGQQIITYHHFYLCCNRDIITVRRDNVLRYSYSQIRWRCHEMGVLNARHFCFCTKGHAAFLFHGIGVP